MKNKVKISVIVPVFNAEQYLTECISSALNQTLDGIEILMINNGSTDKSVTIAEELVAKHKNVRLFHEKKQGPSFAKNLGLKHAVGKYVFFLDADDLVFEDSTLEKLYSSAEKHLVKIAGGGLYMFDSNTGKEISEQNTEFWFEKNQLINYNDYQFSWGYTRFIYNRKFLSDNKISFPDYLIAEDIVFFVTAMLAAKKFYAINNYVYRYRRAHKPGRLTGDRLRDCFKGNVDVFALAKNHGLEKLESDKMDHIIELVDTYLQPADINTDIGIKGSSKLLAKSIARRIKRGGREKS